MYLIILVWFGAGFIETVPGRPFISENEIFFQPISQSPRESRDQLLNIYIRKEKNRTLLCDCKFNLEGKVLEESCDLASKKKSKKVITLAWLFGMPPFKFGKILECWRKPLCSRENGRPFGGPSCCEKKSVLYSQMKSDMHNLFPSTSALMRARVNQDFGEISGEKRKFGTCDLEVNRKLIEPNSNVRGDIARAYFYMSRQYGVPIRERLEDMLREWHMADPPDIWEMDRNSFIEEKQGNRNPFVDYPELVERVKDF